MDDLWDRQPLEEAEEEDQQLQVQTEWSLVLTVLRLDCEDQMFLWTGELYERGAARSKFDRASRPHMKRKRRRGDARKP
jgi:hypothetical protein